MENKIVTGSFLNERLGQEAKIYLDERFDDEQEYKVYSDGSIDNIQGHQVAYDFVTDEVLEELGLKEVI